MHKLCLCMPIARLISRLFDDKRLTCVILVVWLLIVVSVFSHFGILHTQFMSFGPSPQTFYMGIRLDNWSKWWWVASFTFISTAINDFVGDALVPWIQNTVQDHKSIYIPYPKIVCWLITQIWAMYCCVMSIFSIYLLMSQFDFLLIRAVADALVNAYTTSRFLRNKRKNYHKYQEWHTPPDINLEDDNLSIAVSEAVTCIEHSCKVTTEMEKERELSLMLPVIVNSDSNQGPADNEV
jgi:hypothetical protein